MDWDWSWLWNFDWQQFLRDHGEPWGYFLIMGLTFLEGETVVIIAGMLAFQGIMDVNLVLLSALTGTFFGDQFYFAVGRKYGTPLLDKWPHYTKKIDWVFRMLEKYETPFILSFRFIYGIRNVTPFVIGMSNISRIKYIVLNFIAAAVWAASFAYGGYYAGKAIEHFLGEHKMKIIGVIIGVIVVGGVIAWFRKRAQVREAQEEAAHELDEEEEDAVETSAKKSEKKS